MRASGAGRSDGDGGTTASIGVVAADGGQRLTFATLLAQATRAQRQAARAGGDRIVGWQLSRCGRAVALRSLAEHPSARFQKKRERLTP